MKEFSEVSNGFVILKGITNSRGEQHVKYQTKVEHNDLENEEEIKFMIPKLDFTLFLREMIVRVKEDIVVRKNYQGDAFVVGDTNIACVTAIDNL